jgi:hypothetical protein
LVLLGVTISAASTQDNSIVFFYETTENVQTNPVSAICWFMIQKPDEETCVETPRFESYAISPDGSSIAIKGVRENSMDGGVYLLDIENKHIVNFDLYEPVQEFLWDEEYLTSGTMLWSPDGQYLAFTGKPSPDQNDYSDVYLYNVKTQSLTNLTATIPIVRHLITPASWSPDGEWLLIFGAWSEYETAQGYIAPEFGNMLASKDGATFIQIAQGQPTCRLVWSPDMQWLASETHCYEGAAGASSGLIFIPFNLMPLIQDGHRIDEVVSPLHFDWRDSGWNYYYGSPLWIDSNSVIAFRRISPISFGYLSEEQTQELSSSGLVAINLDAYSETLIAEDVVNRDFRKFGDWFVVEQRDGQSVMAINPNLDRTITIPSQVESCPISYALKIEEMGDFIAIYDGCRLSEQTPVIRLYETTDFNLIAERLESENGRIIPLGFVRR